MDVVVLPIADLSKDTGAPADPARLRSKIGQLRRGRQGPTFVLLVGVAQTEGRDAARIVVPVLTGTASRMKGVATDHAFGLPNDKLSPTIAVGRVPPRTTEEAAAMVAKHLAFER